MADDFENSDDWNNFAGSPLAVPQDSLEEIELYPNFFNDPISLSGSDFWQEFETPFPRAEEQQKTRVMSRKRVALQNFNGYANKKQRGKRLGRRAGWSKNAVNFAAGSEESGMRKCSHCQTTETPQWRIGPLGPKTLCNACGVRYKSGRLLPEYRPAASPTFDSNRHSNFHRKILKKKEGFTAQEIDNLFKF